MVKEYHKQILKLKKELGLKSNLLHLFYKRDITPTLLKLPDVFVKGETKVDKNDWEDIEKGIDTAINKLIQFRLDEGKKLEEDIKLRIKKLRNLLTQLEPFSKQRIEEKKKKLIKKIEEIDIKSIDENRFEQELIYYLEKQDITEEQVRLDTHLGYFLETMKTASPNGKKLGFIAQEIGREINTIGSKSSDSNMQKIVVQMKDELEKIKEQLLNIL